jgi:tight adherence protein B
MNNILIGAAALAVVALVEGMYYAFAFVSDRRREDLQRRLQPVTGGTGARQSLVRAGRLSSNRVLEGLLEGVPLLDRMATLLDQAQVGGTVAAQLLFSALLAMAGAVIGVAMGNPAMGGLLFLAGGAVPTVRLLVARARRSRKISEQLPSALDMMARSLRAGHALTSAFKLVATEMPGPINLEFARAYEEQNLGVTFDKAVLQMTNRCPANPDLKIFAVSVIVQKETGGNLVELLEKLADTIRGRYQFYGKLSALTAEGQLSGVVLGSLPIATALFLIVVNYDYISALVTKPMGRVILTYSVITWVVGLIWLRQMGKVDL